VHALAPATTTTIEPDAPADFYSIAYDAKAQGWQCVKTYCENEYLVQAPKAGAYEISLQYRTSPGCMGIELLVDGVSQAKIKLDPAATATAPRTVQLPCGPARLRFRNPNYLDGTFCSSGAVLGRVTVKPAP
jgi:hypothetical protein